MDELGYVYFRDPHGGHVPLERRECVHHRGGGHAQPPAGHGRRAVCEGAEVPGIPRGAEGARRLCGAASGPWPASCSPPTLAASPGPRAGPAWLPWSAPPAADLEHLAQLLQKELPQYPPPSSCASCPSCIEDRSVPRPAANHGWVPAEAPSPGPSSRESAGCVRPSPQPLGGRQHDLVRS